MKRVVAVLFSLSLLLGAAGGAAAATSMRCGSRLVRLGNSKLAVLQICGPPSLRGYSVVTTRHAEREPLYLLSTDVDKWYYNCGSGQLNMTLVFVGGDLVRIHTGNVRGSGPRRCW